jgi:hypothetical protein
VGFVLCAIAPWAGCAAAAGPSAGGADTPKHDLWGKDDSTPSPAASGAGAGRAEAHAGGGLMDIFKGKDTSGGAEDGTYTILLAICNSPTGHAEQAKYYKQATEKHVGWKNLFIVHKDDHSELYWGKYKTLDDAQPNLKKAREYTTPANIKVFGTAIVVPVPGKDDVGPPEWRLDTTPDKYVYTVMLGEFYDVPEADYLGRRKYAVEYCQQLREKGLPAYYKHDPASSIVTVGLFEASAVVLVKKGDKTQRDIRDQRIQSLFAQFPQLAVNGRQKILRVMNTKTKKMEQVPAPTYLMAIPREDKADHANPPASQPATTRPGNEEPRKAPGDPRGAGQPAGPSTGAGDGIFH